MSANKQANKQTKRLNRTIKWFGHEIKSDKAEFKVWPGHFLPVQLWVNQPFTFGTHLFASTKERQCQFSDCRCED